MYLDTGANLFYLRVKEMSSRSVWNNENQNDVNKITYMFQVQDFLEMIQLCRTNISFGGFCDVNRELFINVSFFIRHASICYFTLILFML